MTKQNKQIKVDTEVWCLVCKKPYFLSVSDTCPNCFISELPSTKSEGNIPNNHKGGRTKNGSKEEEED